MKENKNKIKKQLSCNVIRLCTESTLNNMSRLTIQAIKHYLALYRPHLISWCLFTTNISLMERLDHNILSLRPKYPNCAGVFRITQAIIMYEHAFPVIKLTFLLTTKSGVFLFIYFF